MATRADKDVTKAATVELGDAPYDTTHPNERVVSTPQQPGDEARAVGTVNAAVPAAEREQPEPRAATYPAKRPSKDGHMSTRQGRRAGERTAHSGDHERVVRHDLNRRAQSEEWITFLDKLRKANESLPSESTTSFQRR